MQEFLIAQSTSPSPSPSDTSSSSPSPSPSTSVPPTTEFYASPSLSVFFGYAFFCLGFHVLGIFLTVMFWNLHKRS